MGRFTSFALVASVCVVLVAFATTVNAQSPDDINAIQQQPQPGLIDRIMREYVYPIRDYDWRGMARRFMNGVMDYIAPDTKEPKAGTPYYGGSENQYGVARPLGNYLAKWISSKTNAVLSEAFNPESIPAIQHTSETESSEQLLEDGTRSEVEGSSSRLITLNSNISPSVGAHSWKYLGILVAYSAISVLGALIPIFNLPPEPLEEGPEFALPPQSHNHVQSSNFQI